MNYYLKLINFFKNHGINDDTMFKYIHRRTEFIDYTHNELKDMQGIYYKYGKDQQLIDFELCIPYLSNEETVLLSIRPYIQAIYAYNNLCNKYIANYESEILAIHFEKTYLKENPNQKLQDYLNKIYSSIRNQEENTKYKIALTIQEELETQLQNQNNNFENIQVVAKKLSRK